VKKIKDVLFLSLLATAAYAQEIKFEQTEFDYGKIERNSAGIMHINFTNVGDAPLLITSTNTNCGCMGSYAPKEPIMPQEIRAIRVKYDTKRIGKFTKYVMLESNDIKQPFIRIIIKGEVLPPAESENLEKR